MKRLGAIHVHSTYSRDGRDSLADLRRFAVDRSLAFLGLTDHAEDLDAARFEQFTSECAALSDERVALLPGLEFRFAGLKGMHLLALGLRRWIEPGTPAEFFDLTTGAVGLTILAHPIYPKYTIPDVVLDRVDAIEVWNAAYNTRYLPDPRAIQLFRRIRTRRPDLVAVVGLDQHDARNDRETRIEVHGDGDPLAAVRAGRFTNVGRTMRFGPGADLGAVGSAGLWAGRAILDVVERVHERL